MKPFKYPIAAALLASIATAAVAQDYPSRMIRFVVPMAPGGGSDIIARITAQKLAEQWGQQILIDNRVGAGGNIGTDIVAKSTPDGYTWLLSFVGTHAINPSLYKNLSWDPVKDFTPLAMLCTMPHVLTINKDIAAKSVVELIALAKQKPGELKQGSSGYGTISQLLGPMLETAAGIKFTHVPYRGVAAAVTEVMSGQIQLTFTSVPVVIEHVRAGNLRAIAVTSAKRADVMKDVPTIAESGFPGFDVSPWFAILSRADTPQAVVKKINHGVNLVLTQKDMIERLVNQGVESYPPTTPEQVAKIIKADIAKWAIVVKESGAKIE